MMICKNGNSFNNNYQLFGLFNAAKIAMVVVVIRRHKRNFCHLSYEGKVLQYSLLFKISSLEQMKLLVKYFCYY